MNKGDIKATIIMIAYLIVGVFSAYMHRNMGVKPDVANYFFGFMIGLAVTFLLQLIWMIIRLDIED
jgi:uncharacterized membrane protein